MARLTLQKPRRDPNAPKKNQTAWQLFHADHREQVERENPGLSYRDVLVKLGEMWRERDDATKRRYETLYQSGQAEYDEQMAAYREKNKQKRQSSQSKSKKNNASQSQGATKGKRETSPEYADTN